MSESIRRSGRVARTRIVAWGTYDVGKPRVRILLRGLQENGVDVLVCHHDVWGGVEDKSQIKGIARRLGFALRLVAAYPGLIYRYLRLPRHDAVLVSYMGHLDVLVIWLLARLRGVPVIWDAFLSLYNTVVEDRRMLRPGHPLARLLWAWEWLACRAAHRVVLDTRAHADYFVKTFGIAGERMAAAFVGAEPEKFPPMRTAPPADRLPMVLFYGQFIPLHGIDTIIQAARLARDDAIEWVIVGTGQEAARIRAELEHEPLPKLRRMEWVDYAELSALLAQSAVALGIFGDTDKAARVIPNKVFQILMSGKPLVTRDSPAIRELISPDAPGIKLVPPANPSELLRGVRSLLKAPLPPHLHDDLRKRMLPSAVASSLIDTFLHHEN